MVSSESGSPDNWIMLGKHCGNRLQRSPERVAQEIAQAHPANLYNRRCSTDSVGSTE